jgi:hypothetical protein
MEPSGSKLQNKTMGKFKVNRNGSNGFLQKTTQSNEEDLQNFKMISAVRSRMQPYTNFENSPR